MINNFLSFLLFIKKQKHTCIFYLIYLPKINYNNYLHQNKSDIINSKEKGIKIKNF